MTDRQILEAVLAEVKGLGTRMDGFEGRMDRMEDRMDGFEGRMDRMESHMGRMEDRMDGFEGRMDRMESHMGRMEDRMDGFEGHMDRMEKRQERFEEETRNNFADIKLHLENITDKNLSILAENYQNLIDKMNVPIAWTNRVMMNEIRINSLTDQVAKLQESCS